MQYNNFSDVLPEEKHE